MKAASFLLLLALSALAVTGTHGIRGDKTITKVVKLLQKMLDKSKKEADDDRNAFAKYKCYVDQNEAEKSASVKRLGEQVALLESKIAELQARNGELSSQTAALDTSLTENKAAQKSAAEVRDKSEKAFTAMEADLVQAIGQMQEALDVLTTIALGQSKSVVSQAKFMASSSKSKRDATLLNLGTQVRNALNAVSALLPPDSDSQRSLKSFLQAPLSAVQKGQGDAIVGILKNLMSTFKGNLANARNSEKAEKAAFDSSIETLQSSHASMDKSLKEKKSEMGSNDGELAAKKTSLEEAARQKKDDEEFLENLRQMSSEKTKDYDERKMLRANEDAAIAQAISILNSDAAFQTFGEVDATSKGKTSFLQEVRLAGRAAARQQAEFALERAAAESHSARLAKLVSHLRAGNPFSAVLAEIETMKKIIVEEGTADKEKKAWCKKEQTNSQTGVDEKESQIRTLNDAIDKVGEAINDPKTGFKQMITEKEASLLQNQQGQVDQTNTRKQENAAYQEDVSNLASAEDILSKAIVVLKKYYDALGNKENKALMQVHRRQDPTPPKTFDAYSGQSKSGGEAIKMLEFILSETKKERSTADKDEKTSQKDYDDSMDKLKKEEGDMQKALVKLRADLAENEKDLLEKNADLKDTTEAKEAIESYLMKIKPGCDFISANFDLREKNRETETQALDKASTLIKETPAFKAAVAKDKAK